MTCDVHLRPFVREEGSNEAAECKIGNWSGA